MSRRNLNTSRESIILNNCRQNLNGALGKFDVDLNTTLKRESMKKTLAIEDAKTNFNFLKKIKSDLREKLKKEKEEREFPIQKLRDQFRDMTDFKEKFDVKFRQLQAKIKAERVRKQKLQSIHKQLNQRVQIKLKESVDLSKSTVLEYTMHHQSKVKESARLQRLVNQQLNKQKQLQKQYQSKKQNVLKSKQILSSLNTRISEASIYRKVQEVMKQINQNLRVLDQVYNLLYQSNNILTE